MDSRMANMPGVRQAFTNRKQRKGAENSSGMPRGGFSMRSRIAKIILEVVAVVTLGFLLNSCGAEPYCPTCGLP